MPATNIEREISVNVVPIRDAIRTLVPAGQLALSSIAAAGGPPHTRTFDMPHDFNAAVTWAAKENDNRCNLYWTPNVSRIRDRKATAEDMTTARFLWADIDPNVAEFGGYATAREHLLREVLPSLRRGSSYIVDSGNGLQPLLRLTNPMDLTDAEQRDLYQGWNRFTCRMYDGDSTQNADRMMRLPGTVNYPTPTKLKKGYRAEPTLARLVHVSTSTFTPHSARGFPKLTEATDQPSVVEGSAAYGALLVRFGQFLNTQPRAAERYAGSTHGLHDTSGSGRDMSMVSHMKSVGFTFAETRSLLEDWTHGSPVGRQQGHRYWQRMWERAVSTSPAPAQDALPASKAPAQRFRLRTLPELQKEKPLRWHVKNVLPATGLGVVYGASGSGKTFLVLDLGLRLALGGDWFGFRASQCPVVYVALEGGSGIARRLRAWELHEGQEIPSNFHVVTDSFQFFSPDDPNELAQAIAGHGAAGGLVVIDTLNQAAPTADENRSEDMGRIIGAAQRLQELTRSLVLLVHHPGKELSRGMRGHSSLLAALDVAIEVGADAQGKAWTIAKLKDGDGGRSQGFRLHVEHVGVDEEGDQVTSCVVVPDSLRASKALPALPTGHNQRIALREAQRLTAAVEPDAEAIRKVLVEDVVNTVAGALTVDPKRRKERAREAIDGLSAAQFVTVRDDRIWCN